MSYQLKYVHAKSHCLYYFVEFRILGDLLSPVGCFPCRRSRALIFESKSVASKVADYLSSLGHVVYIVPA